MVVAPIKPKFQPMPFDFNGIENGMNVGKGMRKGGGHRAFRDRVRRTLDGFRIESPNATSEEAADFMSDLADDFKDQIIERGGRDE